MAKKKILITGGDGYIGKSLFKAFYNDFDIYTFNREKIDITNKEDVNAYFEDNGYFDVVIHNAIMGGSRLKADPDNTCYNNVLMMENLLSQSSYFGKIINFSSGIEETDSTSPYSVSKRITSEMVKGFVRGYNLKIFGVFDENEWDTRFIKANIKNHIEGKPLEIFQNKYMDFFHMEDLVKLVKFYINSDDTPPELWNCCYKEKYTLLQIATIIGDIGDKEYSIKINESRMGEDYTGEDSMLYVEGEGSPFIKYGGLVRGISRMYQILKKEYRVEHEN